MGMHSKIHLHIKSRRFKLSIGNALIFETVKLTSTQDNLTVLQAINAWNESVLVSLKEKIDVILDGEAEGAELHRVLDDIKCAIEVDVETVVDSCVSIRP
ncbi:hypothetical protein KI387_027372, partial [Taxus chinensis]